MGRPSEVSPWHAGEVEAQRRAGVDPAHIATVTPYLRDHLTEQHRDFYPRLPFIVVGTVDDEGRPWATLLEGRPGFMGAEDGTHLRIGAQPALNDPATAGLRLGAAVGLLGIELETRRRNRLNGWISRIDADSLAVEVDRAFGNCPKYIHTRDLHFVETPEARPDPDIQPGLDNASRAMIRASMTFFVASFTEQPRRQVDVSHRGGRAGFIDVDGDWLTVPDFVGNQFFNTLGNFLANPKAGLLFADFASGDVLQLSGSVEVEFQGPRLAAFEGAQRLWRMRVERMVRRRGALHWRGEVRDPSVEAELTGTWAQARLREAATLAASWRRFRVDAVVDETPEVRSFVLRPLEATGFAPGQAGMHLVLRLRDSGGPRPLVRSYSLSRLPADGGYRISIKADGPGSRELHRRLLAGATLELRGPQGEFVIDTGSPRPVVLMSAGIGLTPMRAMLEQLLDADRASGRRRRIHLLHGARDAASMPFKSELAALQARSDGMVTLVRCFSRPEATDQPGIDYQFEGHLGVETLKQVLPFDDHDFYLCGPPGFMQQVYDGLRGLGIADGRIQAEGFGPASIRRSRPDAATPPPPALPAATQPAVVSFKLSGRTATWQPGDVPLLDFAERLGLQPEFGCRDGSCGTCATRLLGGAVAYPGGEPAHVPPGSALICKAVPAGALTLDL